jgi:FYVE zinc finger
MTSFLWPIRFSSCCASRFTWASTSDSEAQEARDKHNCRSCGALVCHPCSNNLAPLPSIGLTVSVRVCDRCHYNSLDANSSMISFSKQDVGIEHRTFDNAKDDGGKKPIRYRVKLSAIVDDLASRLTTSSLHDS